MIRIESEIPDNVTAPEQVGADWEPWIALSLIPGLGNETFRRLLQVFGLPQNVYTATNAELLKVVKRDIARHISAGIDVAATESTRVWLADPLNSIMTLADADYPRLLLEIADPPPVLYLKGNRSLLGSKCLAIVGSRNATAQGLDNAEALAQALSEAGFTVVSGLAVGIDAAAHRGGLKGAASSIAVVGTGLDIVYPARNRDLAHQLADKGLIVSEFSLGTPAMGHNFPRRNRIISGLSLGTMVVEAGLRSGSLITAMQALEQGRAVFAVPGSIHSPLSKGPHYLLRQGARLVESARDVLEELGVFVESSNIEPAKGSAEARSLLEMMGFDPVDADTLAARCGMTAADVAALLLQFELDGLVKSVACGLFQRL